jgi:hypothetical protein
MTERSSVRTWKAIQARKAMHARTSKEERLRLGLRLYAIYCGYQTQKSYRMKGITDPCVKAREARSRYCAARREAKEANAGYECETRRRSKVNVGWD